MACIDRATWRACGSVPIDNATKDEIAIHHSASANRRWTREQEREHLRAICEDHLARGFATIAYSWMVFPSGRCYVGRGMRGLPAATEDQNSGTWAICLIGTFEDATPTVECRREVRRLIELLRDEHGARHLGGHREFPGQSTDCPGDRAQEFVAKWREDFGLARPEAS